MQVDRQFHQADAGFFACRVGEFRVNDYVPLLEALEGHFEQSLDELPAVLRERVLRDFPMPWNRAPTDHRRSIASQVDDLIAQTKEHERQFWKAFCKEKLAIEQDIAQWESVETPTASDIEKKERRLADLRERLAPMMQQLTRGDYPPWLVGCDEIFESPSSPSPCQPVDVGLLIRHFRVIRGDDKNSEWWRSKTREAKRNGLATCRVGSGKRGRGGGTLWRPDLIAAWLVDRDDKGREGLNSSSAASALKKFTGCADTANMLSSSDE